MQSIRPPDKFNMVDMEGIDILFRYGDSIPGLYQKLVESIAQCRYQCLYNWYFDGLLIPPTYVEMTVIDNKVWIEDGVSVDEEDTLGFLAPGLKSITGAVAHITDALARKAYQIACYINPIQDLHGYDHPWAPGSGKNKFDLNSISGTSGCSFDISGDQVSIAVNGLNTYQGVSVGGPSNLIFPPGTYYIKAYVVSLDVTSYTRIGFRAYNSVFINRTPLTLGQTEFSVTINEAAFFSILLNGEGSSKYANSAVIKDIIVSTTDTSFEPYSNICPIVGHTGLNVYRESSYDAEADPIITVNWQDNADTVYDGMLDVSSGKLVSTDAEIASYNGETLPGVWISSMDEYVEGATPTIGAQVVYRLAEPLTYDLTALQLPTLLQGENYIWNDANGDTSVTYWYNKF